MAAKRDGGPVKGTIDSTAANGARRWQVCMTDNDLSALDRIAKDKGLESRTEAVQTSLSLVAAGKPSIPTMAAKREADALALTCCGMRNAQQEEVRKLRAERRRLKTTIETAGKVKPHLSTEAVQKQLDAVERKLSALVKTAPQWSLWMRPEDFEAADKVAAVWSFQHRGEAVRFAVRRTAVALGFKPKGGW